MPEIYGELNGLRQNDIKKLKKLYEFNISPEQPVSYELALAMANLTSKFKREIAVYINRRGIVTHVSLGDKATVELPDFSGRRSFKRLSCIRCIHTHPSGDSQLSDIDIASLKTLRFDIMASLGVTNSTISEVCFSCIDSCNNLDLAVSSFGPLEFENFLALDIISLINCLELKLGVSDTQSTGAAAKTALLVGLEPKTDKAEAGCSIKELIQLAETAGANVAEVVYQKRDSPDPAYFIGRGKAAEINLLRQACKANVIIFNAELSSAQQRNLETVLGAKVIDRTGLILDIFAQRARSYEGKLQVELAQLRYNLPRLGGQGLILSRLGGGIGTRGPGETKLEADRRRIRTRISEVETEINSLTKHRKLHYERRQKASMKTVALVGYTNAGKSTLLNSLTNADVFAEDKLFATLDPTTRKVQLPKGQTILVSDTVGFIQKLPHNLIAAFRATLEEVVQADILLHIIDAGHPAWQAQSNAVFTVLKELKAENKPIITVFNKSDKINNCHIIERMLRLPASIAISALNNTGIDKLLEIIEEQLNKAAVVTDLLLPYNESSILAELYQYSQVISVDYLAEGIKVTIALIPEMLNRYQKFLYKI